ncbi:MAG: SPOR domain-containing protein [Burkholderiaceae bacterium]|nr:SPOR domain-containing protein [Burkholderiaceae bacterium]
MAIFSTRSSSQRGQEAARKNNVPVDSIETLRTRARQRLIGAVVLVVLGVVGFTLLFDTQPRPIPVDIEISIPDKDKTERLGMPAAPSAAVSAAAAPVTAPVAPAMVVAPAPKAGSEAASSTASAPQPSVQASASLSPKEELLSGKPPAKEAVKTEPKAVPKTEPKPEKKVEKPVEKKPDMAVAVKAEPKPVVKPAVVDDGAKAKAILEGKEPARTGPDAAADVSNRFVVQVGAFADGTKAHEVRVKLERAGLKTYTHVAQTKDGARTRVRVGPFAKRDEAEKAAAKIKKLDLAAAILTL